MKLSLLSLLCLIGVPFALSNKLTAPLFIKQQVTWPVAQNYCRENHIDLFTIKTSNDQVKLIRELNIYKVIEPVWTGLYNDLDSWYWSYNHLPMKNISLKNWNPGQPDNSQGENVCGALDQDSHWVAVYCYQFTAFICYDANNNITNRFVGYGNLLLTWSDAQTYCRQYHTDLATTTTQADITVMVQILSNLHWTGGWIGLTRDTWKWSDGTEPLNLPWISGQPDNFFTWENCGAAQNGQNGRIGDEVCTNQYSFVCSAYLFKKQIVKIQVQSDESVFDPAVQSSILELINQKLQENGMLVNTTATWRVQRDGNIFYKKVKDNE